MQSVHAAAFVLATVVLSLVVASDSEVSVYAAHDFSPCSTPSTARIEEGGCDTGFECTRYDGVGGFGNVTYYGQGSCNSSRDAYLKSAFGDAQYFMVEYYQDANCEQLSKSEVYRADGQCHFHTFGVMKIWVAEDKSMAALTSASYCESEDWGVSLGLNVSVNTGECVARGDYVKYVLVDDSTSGTSGRRVSIYTGYDDSSCAKPSTVKIDESGCNETDQVATDCSAMEVSAGTTYYGQSSCHESRDSYLTATFGDAPLFVVEYYEDTACEQLATSSVYLADGECHYFTLGTMKIWVADDNSMAALTVASSCDSEDWSVFMNLNGSVNTGACIPYNEYGPAAVTFALIGSLKAWASSVPVSVSESHDDSKCALPSTARIFDLEPCSESSECNEYANVGGWGNVTYYGHSTCSSSRDSYLESAFGESPVFMIEYYLDTKCNKRVMSEVYRADGQCHFHTLGVMKIWVAEDRSMAALLSASYCESDNWDVGLGLNVSVNTGDCIPQSEGQWFKPEAVKYILIDHSTRAVPLVPTMPSYGRMLWPVQDKSLCTFESDTVAYDGSCREFTLPEVEQRNFLGLVDSVDQFLEQGWWGNSLLPSSLDQEIPTLPGQLLQQLLPVSDRLFNLWKTTCTRTYDRTRLQEREECRCIHEQLVHGISAAREIQRYKGWHDIDFEWCRILLQRERMLYDETRPIMAALCDPGLSTKYFQQRRAFLDSMLC